MTSLIYVRCMTKCFRKTTNQLFISKLYYNTEETDTHTDAANLTQIKSTADKLSLSGCLFQIMNSETIGAGTVCKISRSI